jgi:hypothetical protein
LHDAQLKLEGSEDDFGGFASRSDALLAAKAADEFRDAVNSPEGAILPSAEALFCLTGKPGVPPKPVECLKNLISILSQIPVDTNNSRIFLSLQALAGFKTDADPLKDIQALPAYVLPDRLEWFGQLGLRTFISRFTGLCVYAMDDRNGCKNCLRGRCSFISHPSTELLQCVARAALWAGIVCHSCLSVPHLLAVDEKADRAERRLHYDYDGCIEVNAEMAALKKAKSDLCDALYLKSVAVDRERRVRQAWCKTCRVKWENYYYGRGEKIKTLNELWHLNSQVFKPVLDDTAARVVRSTTGSYQDKWYGHDQTSEGWRSSSSSGY